MLSACATLRAYDGPPRRSSEVARLSAAIMPQRQILIRTIDGRPLGVLQDRVEVLPGAHEVEAIVTLQSLDRQTYFIHRLRFTAEAGREYVLYAEVDLYGPRSFIMDETAAKVVAETVTRGGPSDVSGAPR